MQTLLPYEKNLAATQFCIGAVKDPKYHYKLELSNLTPIKSKPMPLTYDQEEWMSLYIKEMIQKGVIAPIAPHEDPIIVTPVFLVPGA